MMKTKFWGRDTEFGDTAASRDTAGASQADGGSWAGPLSTRTPTPVMRPTREFWGRDTGFSGDAIPNSVTLPPLEAYRAHRRPMEVAMPSVRAAFLGIALLMAYSCQPKPNRSWPSEAWDSPAMAGQLVVGVLFKTIDRDAFDAFHLDLHSTVIAVIKKGRGFPVSKGAN